MKNMEFPGVPPVTVSWAESPGQIEVFGEVTRNWADTGNAKSIQNAPMKRRMERENEFKMGIFSILV